MPKSLRQKAKEVLVLSSRFGMSFLELFSRRRTDLWILVVWFSMEFSIAGIFG